MKNKVPSQKMCDDLLSPIIKKLFPQCMLCGKPTTTAHHFIHKSKSLTLRYNFKNLIPLCSGCHFKLHQNEGYWSAKIVVIRGIKWFKKLEKDNQVKITPDYPTIYKTLSKIK